MNDLRIDLTRREFEILECLARGLTNGEIARELEIAQSTVKAHLSSMYAKMGVSNRTQAALAAVQSESWSPVHAP